ncbi:hypothetical protein PILCRDRAFT_316430 [Piloderma croceum F 1598]|uniref:t-SNARE coiled-coil homology domain-containing protein n=1 Tax=Piloderma croceum (strain F 1598) TaxID=765440 RepID=A0A0C3BK85_PILCF|nr:hypothetical protein PILCRDRAFT_316430 [Piloderma croceum F 1598]
MSTDPYHAVQHEIQSSLQMAATLRASFLRIRNMARDGSEELVWARNELKATLAGLEADLEDLDESVKCVAVCPESTGARMFGLDDAEVTERRRYVGRVRRELQDMRAEVEGAQTVPQTHTPLSPNPNAHISEDDAADHQKQWAREEQQMMIQEQDRTMDTISGTLSTLAQQAGLMGQEIEEHNEMLGDLEMGVDRTDSKLSEAMRRMRKFIRQTEETKSGWCIIILIIILMILLVAVILV